MNKMTLRKLSIRLLIPTLFILGISTAFFSSVLSTQTSTEAIDKSNFSMNLWIEGIDGECIIASRDGSIDILSYSHSIKNLYDIYTRESSNIVHTPFRIVKEIDKATPKLFQYLVEETPALVTFRIFAEPNELNFLTVELSNAIVVSISDYATISKDKASLTTEQVSFTYFKIKWIYTEFDDLGNPKGSVEFEAWWGGLPPT